MSMRIRYTVITKSQLKQNETDKKKTVMHQNFKMPADGEFGCCEASKLYFDFFFLCLFGFPSQKTLLFSFESNPRWIIGVFKPNLYKHLTMIDWKTRFLPLTIDFMITHPPRNP